MRFRLRTLLIVLAIGPPLIAYVPGYFWMGRAQGYWKNEVDGSSWMSPPPKGRMISMHRQYPRQWQAKVFWPIGRLESLVRGIDVYTEPEIVLDREPQILP